MVSSTDRRLRFLKRRRPPRRIGARVIRARQIRRNAVETPAIAPDAVTDVQIAPDAVTEVQIAPDAVTDVQIAPDAVTDVQIAPGAVTEEGLADGSVARGKLVEAVKTEIETAQSTADGKNKVYRQSSAPAGTSHTQGDVWFDTDDDNKIYRWTGSAWSSFELGDGALASISANKITAGTIDASIITVSNLDAGRITTGTLSATRIGASSITAEKIGALAITSEKISAGAITTEKIAAGVVSAFLIDGGQITGGTISASVSFVLKSGATITSESGGFQVNATGGVYLNNLRAFSGGGDISVLMGGQGRFTVQNSTSGINGEVATTSYTDGRYRRLGVSISGSDISNGTITGTKVQDGSIRATDCDIGTGSGQIARGSHIHDVQGSSGTRTQTFSGNQQTLSHSHTSGNYTAAISTIRLKKQVTPHKFDTSKLLDLELVKFKYKNQVKEHQNNKEWAYGYIAEDVLKLGVEEVVGYKPDGKVASINYGVLSTLILELVKEHHTEIENIKKDIRKIDKETE